MRADGRKGARIRRDGHRHRRGQPRLVAQPVDLVVHVAQTEAVARDDLGDRALEEIGEEAVEDLEETGRRLMDDNCSCRSTTTTSAGRSPS